MSINSERHSLLLRSKSQDTRIGGAYAAPRRRSHSRPARPVTSGVPAAMGPPNHAPGLPVMGATDWGLHLHVMGGPDAGPHLDPMGAPDTAPRVDVFGESDLTFVDSLFTPRRSFR